MSKRRIVVTGMGIASPIGNSVQNVWQSARDGVSGIGTITLFNPDVMPSKVGGEVKDFDPEELYGRKEARRMDRVTQLTLFAAQQAIEDSGLEITESNAYDIGCIVGTGIGGIQSLVEAVHGYTNKGVRGVSPTMIPRLLSDNTSGVVTINYGLKGPNYCVITACATGNNAIGEAVDLIRLGRAKAMLAGSSEAGVNEVIVAGFSNLKVLSTNNGDPPRAVRPFDVNREGFAVGEGSALFMLEELEHAKARGATIYAEITGYGHTSDAYHVTAPQENGMSAARAMELAIKDAGLQPRDIDYINAHGTGTQLNDTAETKAIKHALGEAAYDVPISSTKALHGHALGGTSSIEAVITIEAVRHNYVPPTMNLETPDPECDLDYVPNTGREKPLKHAMSNSFGFGGHNAVIVISKYEE